MVTGVMTMSCGPSAEIEIQVVHSTAGCSQSGIDLVGTNIRQV